MRERAIFAAFSRDRLNEKALGSLAAILFKRRRSRAVHRYHAAHECRTYLPVNEPVPLLGVLALGAKPMDSAQTSMRSK